MKWASKAVTCELATRWTPY